MGTLVAPAANAGTGTTIITGPERDLNRNEFRTSRMSLVRPVDETLETERGKGKLEVKSRLVAGRSSPRPASRVAVLVLAFFTAACAGGTGYREPPDSPNGQLERRGDALAPAQLEPREYGLWEGDWFNTNTYESFVYERLGVADADPTGFTYSFECRLLPYGPNAVWTNEARASFSSPLRAENKTDGHTFVLSVDSDDRQFRHIQAGARSYGAAGCGSPGDLFAFRRVTFEAGFDCDRGVTPVEEAICHNEVIALGDREVAEAYLALRAYASAENRGALFAAQRRWLIRRNSACLGSDEAVNEICLARFLSDRLVELARIGDTGLGAGPQFDAAYVTALLNRGVSLNQDAAVRLAMYPLVVGTSTWQADEEGILFESTHVEVHIVWPADVDFRYSQMLFVGADGSVWNARHIEPLLELEHAKEINPYQLWMEAGGEPFTIRSDTGIESARPPAPADDVPGLVRSWLDRHPISEVMRHLPPDAVVQRTRPNCEEWNTEGFFRNATDAGLKHCPNMGKDENGQE